MEFQFEVNIKETKGALNTAAKVAEILKGAEVTFGVSKAGQPSIWAKIGDKSHFIACFWTGNESDHLYQDYCTESQRWATIWAKQQYAYCEEPFLFSHLTEAAKKLVDQWIMSLCDEYYKRILADA